MAQRVEIRIDQGSKWSKVVEVRNPDGSTRDLSGYAAKMDIKKHVTDASPLLQLTSPAGGITVNALAGQITVTITATQTAAMTWTTGVYDLKIVPGDPSAAERVMEGAVGVFPQVTV